MTIQYILFALAHLKKHLWRTVIPSHDRLILALEEHKAFLHHPSLDHILTRKHNLIKCKYTYMDLFSKKKKRKKQAWGSSVQHPKKKKIEIIFPRFRLSILNKNHDKTAFAIWNTNCSWDLKKCSPCWLQQDVSYFFNFSLYV